VYQVVLAGINGAVFWLSMIPDAAAQTGGRQLTNDDWSDKIPVLIGSIIVVLIVNGIGLYFINRSRKRERAAAEALRLRDVAVPHEQPTVRLP